MHLYTHMLLHNAMYAYTYMYAVVQPHSHHTACMHMCAHQAHVCVGMCAQMNMPHAGQGPQHPSLYAELSTTSLQEISNEAVYTIFSKEIIIIITLSDLAVKFL